MKFLVIQTAFLGDVILATSVIEKLREHFPDSEIDFLLRKGNESLFENHPFIHEILILDKKKNKVINLFETALRIRKRRYDYVINIHRFASSGLLTLFSGGKERIGFLQNPFSFCYTKKVKHEIPTPLSLRRGHAKGRTRRARAGGEAKHEIERNHELLKHLTDEKPAAPKLYSSQKDIEYVQTILTSSIIHHPSYICLAPASVWFTKQFPKEKWLELIEMTSTEKNIFLIGSKNDFALCEDIIQGIKDEGSAERRPALSAFQDGLRHFAERGRSRKTERIPSTPQSGEAEQRTIVNLCGKLSLLETATLMKGAEMNYVNDSAPLHIASSVNAPVTAIFCSTVPEFGFGPLSAQSFILQTEEKLDCRPCGLHGHRACPEKHFKCAYSISINNQQPSFNSHS